MNSANLGLGAQSDPSTFRSYLFFWSGQLVSLLGSSIAQFVIIWWITVETGSAMYLSLASFLGLAPMVLLSPFTGVLADRWNRKALIFTADLLQALATVALILLFAVGNIQIWQILAILTLRGILQAFHSPTVSAIIPSMVSRDKLSRINGLNYLLSGAVALIGPVIAAVLLGFWEIGQILWIDALTFLVALVPLLIITIPSVRKKQEQSSFKTELVQGLTFIKKARGLLSLLILAAALNFLLTPLSTLLPYYVKFDHLGEATDLAFVTVFLQGGILAGGLLMSITKGFKNKMTAIVISIYVIFAGYGLIALTPTGLFWFMATSALILAICLPIANVSTQTIIQTDVPLEMQGRVGSVATALASAAQPFGMILSGVIVELTKTANLFLACTITGILILTISWFFTDIRHVELLGQEEPKSQDGEG
jgi:DHA3 family macrolide efflux protein-like MFS transporter